MMECERDEQTSEETGQRSSVLQDLTIKLLNDNWVGVKSLYTSGCPLLLTEKDMNKGKPSSSSHCAELLGSNVPIFCDFSTAKDSFFGKSEELNCNIDVNFQIVLKKMTKKDSTTKLKALQEFTDLCKNSEPDVVKMMLPFWPRLYCTLATDVEHRVREGAHFAHSAIVEKVKKSIAPYLKQLAGPWFTSQYDSYPPAASAASAAFEQAFPPTKQNKVITFCQEEILNYIYESLIKHTPQTLSNPKLTRAEEMDAKYQRIVIASLQGYNFYLQKLSSDEIKEAEESNKRIISSPKFWEYSKNKIPLIRNSFFNVIISLCQNAKFLLKNEMKRVTVSIFNDLDDSDPSVLTSVWDAALNALVFLEDCWAHVNLEKQVFAKLNGVIRKGGRNAITIFPSILPLLSKIPPDLLKDETEFYGKLFQNIRIMVEGSGIVNPSLSDGKTIAITFTECLKYVILQHSSDANFCMNLVTNQLIPVVEKMLSTPNSMNSPITMAFFVEISSLLCNWHSNPSSNKENYSVILKLFWESLLKSCERMVDLESSSTSLCEILNLHLEFLQILQKPEKYIYKPKKRLKFSNDSFDVYENADVVDSAVKDGENSEFKRELSMFARKLAGVYVKKLTENEVNVFIPYLNNIVNLFDSKSVFEEFLVVLNESSLYLLFCTYFCKWLESSSLRRKELVEMCFTLMEHVGQEEKELILKKFFNDWFNSEFQYDICKSLLRYSNDDSVRSWISSQAFSENLIKLTKNFLSSDTDNAVFRDLITLIFKAKDGDGDYVIGDGTASSIIDLLSDCLEPCSEKSHVRELAQSIILYVDPETLCGDSYEKLIVSLFKLSCYHGDDEALIQSCDTGIRNILKSAGADFVQKIALATTEIILNDNINFCLDYVIRRIDNFMELSTGENIGGSSTFDMKPVNIIRLFLKEPKSITIWRKRIEKCCFIGYQSIGDCDMNFVDLKQNQIASGVVNENLVEDVAEEILIDFENNIPTLRTGNLIEDHFKNVLIYFQMFNNVKGNNSQSDEECIKSETDLSKMLRTFSKWNVYVGSILNYLVKASAHNAKFDIRSVAREKAIRVKEDQEDTDDTCEGSQKSGTSKDDLSTEDRLGVILVCAEMLDFIFSVGLVVSFSQYYASTKYFQVLGEFTSELNKIGCELLKNTNSLENLFLYGSCMYFTSNLANWRIIKPVLTELFGRSFIDEEAKLEEDFMLNFLNTEISRFVVDENTLLKLLCILQKKVIFLLNEEEWNKIFIYLHKFFENSKSETIINEKDVTTLSVLARITVLLMKLFDEKPETITEERLCPEACLAWREVVKSELWNSFFKIWQKAAQKWHNKYISPHILMAIQNVSEVITTGRECQKQLDSDNLKLTVECIQYITSSYTVFQITSFHLLMGFVPELVKIDTETFCENLSKITEDIKEGSFNNSSCSWSCENLEKVISSNQTIIETLLSDFVIGDCCSVKPFTDSFNYTYSYLLIWCFLLEMCGEAHSSLRFQYGFWFRDKGYAKSLLESVFKLMPQSVIHGSEAKEQCARYFENHVPPSVKEPVTSERIEEVSCFVYRMFIQRLPNIVREWWNQSENKTCIIVDKVTMLYVSPILIANELKSVQQDKEGFDNMEVKTHPSAREVIATYTIDEVKMDLVMTLPQNYPLGTIKIESSNVVVSNSSRRNWLFHISKYLIHQNGNIWEALVMWKNNLDKRFEGVEECYICASILQGSTFETPKVCCQICKKKFHSHCLYKWFSTSNNSSCPICRNLF